METVLEYKTLLEKFKDKKRMVMSTLEELYDMTSIDYSLLKETGIGKTVNGFRKTDGEVGELARKIIAKWKSLTSDIVQSAKSKASKAVPEAVREEKDKDILNMIGAKKYGESTPESSQISLQSTGDPNLLLSDLLPVNALKTEKPASHSNGRDSSSSSPPPHTDSVKLNGHTNKPKTDASHVKVKTEKVSSHSKSKEFGKTSSHSKSSERASSHSRSKDSDKRSSHSKSKDSEKSFSHSKNRDSERKSSHSKCEDSEKASSHSRSKNSEKTSSHSKSTSKDSGQRSSHSRSKDWSARESVVSSHDDEDLSSPGSKSRTDTSETRQLPVKQEKPEVNKEKPEVKWDKPAVKKEKLEVKKDKPENGGDKSASDPLITSKPSASSMCKLKDCDFVDIKSRIKVESPEWLCEDSSDEKHSTPDTLIPPTYSSFANCPKQILSDIKVKTENSERHSKRSHHDKLSSSSTSSHKRKSDTEFADVVAAKAPKSSTSEELSSHFTGEIKKEKVDEIKTEKLTSSSKSAKSSSSKSTDDENSRKRKSDVDHPDKPENKKSYKECNGEMTSGKHGKEKSHKSKKSHKSDKLHKSKKSSSGDKHRKSEKPTDPAPNSETSFEQSLASIKYPNLVKKKKKPENLEQKIAKAVIEAPLPASYLDDIPELLTDYKPLPHSTAETNSQNQSAPQVLEFKDIKASSRSDAVYSGRKRGLTSMQSLYQLCINVLSNNIDEMGYVGAVPYSILEPVLSKASPLQLFNIEEYNPEFTKETDGLWRSHCNKDFRGQQRDESNFESWRELYQRKFEERERKFEMLQSKISAKEQQKQLEVRKSQVAYTMSSQPKPPREVRRQQAKYGTGSGSVESTAKAAAIMKTEKLIKSISCNRSSSSNSSDSRSSAAPVKPIMSAPLMKKAKKFMSKLHYR